MHQKPEYRTYQEYLRHPKFRVIRNEVMEKAGWLCQDCFNSRATEVHHIKYPPWGSFDNPENIIPLCHNCHCKRHGVEN